MAIEHKKGCYGILFFVINLSLLRQKNSSEIGFSAIRRENWVNPKNHIARE